MQSPLKVTMLKMSQYLLVIVKATHLGSDTTKAEHDTDRTLLLLPSVSLADKYLLNETVNLGAVQFVRVINLQTLIIITLC